MRVEPSHGCLEKAIASEWTNHLDYPRETIESILLLGHILFDGNIMDWEMADYPVKIQGFLANMERMLGTKAGALEDFLQMFAWLTRGGICKIFLPAYRPTVDERGWWEMHDWRKK